MSVGCENAYETICLDFKHQYTGRQLAGLGIALAVALPLANTHADQNFSAWYQGHLRSPATDHCGQVGYQFGRHMLTVPIFVSAALIDHALPESETAHLVSVWGQRSIRMLIVGSPTVGVLQYGLGAGRPTEFQSEWHPFRDKNSVAGHGFVGAIPFLAAASMTDRPVLQGVLLAGSFWTSWSRINSDAHYLSQAILGWSIAYLSMQSILDTDWERQRVTVTPLEPTHGTGMGILFRY